MDEVEFIHSHDCTWLDYRGWQSQGWQVTRGQRAEAGKFCKHQVMERRSHGYRSQKEVGGTVGEGPVPHGSGVGRTWQAREELQQTPGQDESPQVQQLPLVPMPMCKFCTHEASHSAVEEIGPFCTGHWESFKLWMWNWHGKNWRENHGGQGS